MNSTERSLPPWGGSDARSCAAATRDRCLPIRPNTGMRPMKRFFSIILAAIVPCAITDAPADTVILQNGVGYSNVKVIPRRGHHYIYFKSGRCKKVNNSMIKFIKISDINWNWRARKRKKRPKRRPVRPVERPVRIIYVPLRIQPVREDPSEEHIAASSRPPGRPAPIAAPMLR